MPAVHHLWSSRRCGWVLAASLVLFIASTALALQGIRLRPVRALVVDAQGRLQEVPGELAAGAEPRLRRQGGVAEPVVLQRDARGLHLPAPLAPGEELVLVLGERSVWDLLTERRR